jgi:hypothetical protein
LPAGEALQAGRERTLMVCWQLRLITPLAGEKTGVPFALDV